MTTSEETATAILDSITEQVLDRHDGPIGRAETHFFIVASVSRDNEVIEAAWMAFVQRQSEMWQELARLAFSHGDIFGQTGGVISAETPEAVKSQPTTA